MRLDDVDYAELERLLRNWRSLTGEHDYDFVGMLHLFRACVLNLMEHSTDDDWSCVQEVMEPAELEFLLKVAHGFQSGLGRNPPG